MLPVNVTVPFVRRYSDSPRRRRGVRRLRLRRRVSVEPVRRRSPGWAIDRRLRERSQLHPHPRPI